jgi:hypothetical protein
LDYYFKIKKKLDQINELKANLEKANKINKDFQLKLDKSNELGKKQQSIFIIKLKLKISF